MEGDKVKADNWIIKKELSNPKNKQIANEYLGNLKSLYKKQTIRNHMRTLENFLLDQAKDIELLEPNDLECWLKVQCGTLKPSTYNLNLGILRAFFTYCQDEGYIKRSPIKCFRMHIHKPIPKYLSDYQLALIKFHSSTLSLRDRAIIEFMLSTRCQSIEVSRFNIQDISLQDCRAFVTGKGMTGRVVYFPILVSIIFREYLENRTTNEIALFLGKTGKRITPKAINSIIHRLGKIVGLNETLTASHLRNSVSLEIKPSPGFIRDNFQMSNFH
ncbi:tyrosine-type recombinase/integrase [Desulfosporosinus sp. I2]|uniref:site-specific integrase n=1 Tax=Desulfosporosinus sp. I2 TaxID=1617025 RepID=UPI000A532833|nr:tyrosine-type recombinase/integrase [Desulfosporosinus sp. I2]